MASFAEIGVTQAIGKLQIPADLQVLLTRSGISVLPLNPEYGLGVGNLPMHHQDPFDRLLISQAQAERSPWSAPTVPSPPTT